MAFETKALLILLAEVACMNGERQKYNAIQKMANAEGTVIKSYGEARAEYEKEKNEKN